MPDMRIALVTDYFPGLHKFYSGAEIVCVRLGELLAEADCSVMYLTAPAGNGSSVAENVYSINTPLARFPAIPSNLPVDLWGYRSAYRLLDQLRPDVVHFVAKMLFPSVMAACIRLNIPTAFTVVDQYLLCPKVYLRRRDGADCRRNHGIWCGSCMRYDSGGNIMELMGAIGGGHMASLVRARLVDRLGRQLSAIVTLSETSKQRLVEYGFDAEKIHPIYHYRIKIDDNDTSPDPFPEPSVLYAGSLTEVRGPQVAIKAFKYVTRAIPDAVLRIVGPDIDVRPYKPDLDKLVKKLGLENNVLFMGKRENKEVIKTIKRSNIVIVPLQWPNEFGPVALIEAKYMGKPIVASRIGATHEFIEDGKEGFLVEHDNPTAFAERIIYMLRNPDIAKQMGEYAHKSTEFLQGSGPTEKIMDLYKKITPAAYYQ